MFPYSLQLALRTILKNRLYSFVSILGLGIGLTVSILVLSFIRYETGFDRMHFGSERIYRLNWEISGTRFATFFNGATPILAGLFPQIETFTRLAPRNHLLTIDGVNQFGVVTMVDNDFFNIFNYEIVIGEAEETILDMTSAVITEAAAEQYFGVQSPTDVVGRVFTVDGQFDFQIAAVVANNPGNSHLGSNIFVNIENLPSVWGAPGIMENFGSDVFYHYLRLAPDTDHLALQSELASAYSQELRPGFEAAVYLQPLGDIHFTTDLQNEMSMRDDVLNFVKPIRQRSDVLVFSAVALLTLAIATINFMNLQLVQFTRRTHEVALKRIIGASRASLFSQFLLETTLIAIGALLVAVVLYVALLPYFNTMVAATIEAGIVFTPAIALLLLFSAVAVGLLAGVYPATAIARLSPSSALRGEVVKGVSSTRFRGGLIVTQFAISVGLIVSAGVINSQIDFALSTGLGFDPSNVVTVELPNNTSRNAFDAMRNELVGEPGITSVSVADIIPGRDLSNGFGFSRVNGIEQPFAFRSVNIGDDYFQTLGMELVAGRAIDDDFPSDRLGQYSDTNIDRIGAIVVNETAARAAGFCNPADAVGAEVYSGGEFGGVFYTTSATIVGVTRDTQFGSIRAVMPAIGFALADSRNVMIVKITGDNPTAALEAIDRVWQENINEIPIQRNFLSDSYQVFYAGEQRTLLLFMVLSVMAVGIACLGLYAVTTFIAERRAKEISIRKVLGATAKRLAGMLTWDFSKLVLLANIIAWPVAWWGMQQWLSNFNFRTDISFGIFLLAGLVTFAMALATTFQRAWIVANRNPVESLRAD